MLLLVVVDGAWFPEVDGDASETFAHGAAAEETVAGFEAELAAEAADVAGNVDEAAAAGDFVVTIGGV